MSGQWQPITREQAEEVVKALAKEGTISGAARALGLDRSTYRHRLRSASRYGLYNQPAIPAAARPLDGFVVRRNSVTLDKNGKVVQQAIQTGLDSGEPFKVPEGHVIKGRSALVDAATGNTIVEWVKTREERGLKDIVPAIREALAEFEGRAPAIVRPAYCDADLLTIYVIPDAHVGMLAWGRETGEDYDLAIARKVIADTVADLVSQARPSHEALVLWLGDTTHGNDKTNMTPRSGHILDVDGRWPKVLRVAAELAIEVVEKVAAKHARPIVSFIPGNHDPDAAFALSLATQMFFSKSAHIEVADATGPHFYHRFGDCLIGATHGHTVKPERMAMMMAADRREEWGQTRFQHMFFGHVHRESAFEDGPVRVESFNSPAARDAYAWAGGYRSGRSLNAITYHKTRGEIGRHRVQIAPARVRVKAA